MDLKEVNALIHDIGKMCEGKDEKVVMAALMGRTTYEFAIHGFTVGEAIDVLSGFVRLRYEKFEAMSLLGDGGKPS